MKANEFVKKFGWEDAKICLLNCASPQDKWFMRQGALICDQDFDDLKRIVESHELVERLGGIETMRIMQKQMVLNSLKDGMNISFDGEFVGTFSFDQLEQAILDVESCQ